MRLAIQMQPGQGECPVTAYRLDADTQILSARINREARCAERDPFAIVHVSGHDGSWMHLEIRRGRLDAVEIAVWPELLHDARLAVPVAGSAHCDAIVTDRSAPLADGAVLSLSGRISARHNPESQLLQLRFGSREVSHVARAASSLYVGCNAYGGLSALWLGEVPEGVGSR